MSIGSRYTVRCQSCLVVSAWFIVLSNGSSWGQRRASHNEIGFPAE